MLRLTLSLTLFAGVPTLQADAPVFQVQTVAGKQYAGELGGINGDVVLLTKSKFKRTIKDDDFLTLQQTKLPLPALPTEDHLVLAGGDRLPFTRLRLEDEKILIQHPDLNAGKETAIPLTQVVLIWRMAPDRVVMASRFRHQLRLGKRSRDIALLRNGDRLEGTLNRIGTDVEIETKKPLTVGWAQVSAIALNTDLTEKRKSNKAQYHVILAGTLRSPGGRLTLHDCESDGTVFTGKTTFGATLKVPIERVLSMRKRSDKIVSLVDLTATKYEYFPYLDEKWPWYSGANALGDDLVVDGSTYTQGIGMHAHSLLRYSLEGKYRFFVGQIGLDQRSGRQGRVQVRVLVDGKPVELPKMTILTHDQGAVPIRVNVEGAKELTLEVLSTENGPVQAVVNWVHPVLIK